MNKKGQITIEFLSSLLFYLIFLSLLISAVHYYSLTIENKAGKLTEVLKIEEIARIFDSYYLNPHFSLDLGKNEYQFNNNLIYSKENSVAAETLYSEEELNGEAV